MRGTSSSVRSWWTDRLIATFIESPSSAQTRIWRQLSSITQLPSPLISPKRSAIGMNTLGPTMPRVG